MKLVNLKAKPFYLSDEDIKWVERYYSRNDNRRKNRSIIYKLIFMI